MKIHLFTITFLTVSIISATSQSTLSAKEIVVKSNDKLTGLSSYSDIRMSIIRPTWTREIELKSWSKGDDYALIIVTAPARDRGTAFLKRVKELWNWQPSIDRVIKMPPSMMMQSWMGSDFTNDDIVKQSSIVDDYSHSLSGEEVIQSRSCYIVELIPKEDAAVVWGKLILWIDKVDFMQLKAEFYDEDGYLMHTMLGEQPKLFDNKLLPSRVIIIPADEEGHSTVVEYLELTFDAVYGDDFFSIRNMKTIR